MRGFKKRTWCLARFPAAVLVLHFGVLAVPVEASTRESLATPSPRVFMVNATEATSVRQAVRAAARRLADGRCQQVFSDFRDESGRSLQERLDRLGQTGPSYLGLIHFGEGAGIHRCSKQDVIAVTAPGSRVVFICGGQFQRAYEKNPAQVEAIVIHEALHSLGLGENPPTSDAITAQVMARCR